MFEVYNETRQQFRHSVLPANCIGVYNNEAEMLSELRIKMKYFTLAALIVIGSTRANAYIDAGTGSYLLQMGMAGVLAVVYAIKLYWKKLVSFASNAGKKSVN